MKILEKDLKQIVWEANSSELRERGFPVTTYSKRIKDLHIGNYGIADMIFVDRAEGYLNISIFVFKEGKIGISAFLEGVQLRRGIDRYLSKRTNIKKDQIQIYVQLIGSEVDTSGSFCYLTDIYYDIGFYIYSLGIHGFSFIKSIGYKLTDEGF